MDHTRLKDLATATNQLYTMRPLGAAIVANVEQDLADIAALSWRDDRQAANRKPAGKNHRKQPVKKPEESELSKAARLAAGVCLRHWRYGSKAFSCEGNCCWAGNE